MIRALFGAYLSLLGTLVQAGDLQALLANGDLQVASSIEPAGTIVPGQRARLVLSVSTSTWFTGGTRIRVPEVPGLVILQNEKFAANSSETRGGRTWVVQRWTLDVYPQRPGNFRLGPVTLSVQVNAGDGAAAAGEVRSPPVDLTVSIPAALAQAGNWVASPAFSVSQRVDRDLATLQPGDAFERRIEFRADDVLAMMLPVVEAQDIQGLAAYPAPAQLDNRSNRGRAVATRTRVISYVAEQPGSYVLPAQDFFWWDTRSQTLQVLTLDALTVEVAGAVAGIAPEHAIDRDWRWTPAMGSSLVAMALATWLLWRYQPWRRLGRLAGPLRRAQACWFRLRRPALPDRLNP